MDNCSAETDFSFPSFCDSPTQAFFLTFNPMKAEVEKSRLQSLSNKPIQVFSWRINK